MPVTFALALALVPATAYAAPADSTPFETTVAHDDLDLTTPEGAARLEQRVLTKVRRMCALGGRDGTSLRLERECRATALAATAPAIRLAIANARLDQVRLAQTDGASPAATPGV